MRNKTSKFRMRHEPILLPRGEKVTFRWDVHSGDSLAAFVAWAEENQLPLESVVVDVEGDYDYQEYWFQGEREENDNEYGVRLTQYQNAMRSYEEWQQAHILEIDQKCAKKTTKAQLEQKVKKLQAQIKELED